MRKLSAKNSPDHFRSFQTVASMRVDSIIDGYQDTVNDRFAIKKEALRALILLGFFRHMQEGLNKTKRIGGTAKYRLFPLRHYSMPPAPGYPLAGCSPAEPASVSPGNFMIRVCPVNVFWSCFATVLKQSERTVQKTATRRCAASCA